MNSHRFLHFEDTEVCAPSNSWINLAIVLLDKQNFLHYIIPLSLNLQARNQSKLMICVQNASEQIISLSTAGNFSYKLTTDYIKTYQIQSTTQVFEPFTMSKSRQ